MTEYVSTEGILEDEISRIAFADAELRNLAPQVLLSVVEGPKKEYFPVIIFLFWVSKFDEVFLNFSPLNNVIQEKTTTQLE